jgi:hypothetical protein
MLFNADLLHPRSLGAGSRLGDSLPFPEACLHARRDRQSSKGGLPEKFSSSHFFPHVGSLSIFGYLIPGFSFDNLNESFAIGNNSKYPDIITS